MTAAGRAPSTTRHATPAPIRSRFRRQHLYIWVGAVIAAVVVGSVGYVLLLGWTPMDALYMTIITLTTVGFREVGELGTIGQLWTSLLAITAVAIIFGTVGIAAEFIVEEVTSGRREVRRMHDAIDGLSGHFVLCGYGRVGATVARELVDAGRSVVVVDLVQESLQRAREDGHLVVLGDATTDAILRQAGVERAQGLVTAIDTDALNVYVILSARNLNPVLTIIGRANTLEAEEKLLRAGADRIVSPYTRAGHRMAELAVRPGVVDYLDAALDHNEPAFGLESVSVIASGGLDGRMVGEVRADGIVVLAIAHTDGTHARFESNPPDDRRLAAGESVIASGDAAALARLRFRA
ncbi:MAG TPA: potassium channel family protein [Candidatus Limnocylindrales bacterium]